MVLALAGLLGVCALGVGVYVLATLPPEVDTAPFIERAKDYDVTITRDTWGVPHVHGRTDPDAAFGLAYAHAEDDFKTIQQVLLVSRGMLASSEGPDAAKADFLAYFMGVAEAVEAGYERDLGPRTRALAEAYADGLNYYAALHPDETRPYALPITGRDVVAGFVFKTPFFHDLDKDVIELFKPSRARGISLGPGQAFRETADPSPHIGSQGIAVAPSRTPDGATRLLVNSHQPLTGPVAWYEAHVRSDEGWDMVGALFPGSPVIIHGHNRHIGWAATVNHPDVVDTYVLETDPDDPDRYLLDGEWKTLESREISLWVQLLGPLRWAFTRTVLSSEHGPVLRQEHGTYALRWPGIKEVRHLEQLYRMNRAETMDEWLDAMRMRAMPSINFVYADETGNIAYLYNASIPKRTEGFDWDQYLPGDRSELIWNELIPFEQLPLVRNPPSGFVVNANHTPFRSTTGPGNPDPNAVPKTAGIETDMTNRALRALELLGGDESISAEEFVAYKFDDAYAKDSVAAEVVQRVLASELPDDPVIAEARAALEAWDLTTDAANKQAAIGVLTTYPTITARTKHEPDPDAVARFIEVARMLHGRYGTIEVPWGEVNRLRHGEVDLPLAGAPDVLRAVYSKLDEETVTRTMTTGDSYVMFIEWDKDGAVSSQAVHAFGSATLDESSPHYADQSPLFADERLRPVWFDEAALEQHIERRYRPGEEPR